VLYRASIHLEVKADGFAFVENGAELEGELPAVTGVPQSTFMGVFYAFDQASSFDWMGGPLPTAISEGTIEWDETPTSTLQAIPVSAANRAAQLGDSNRTFAAGVLSGIAGGALVGFLQELLHVHPQVVGSPTVADAQTRSKRRPQIASPRERNSKAEPASSTQED